MMMLFSSVLLASGPSAEDEIIVTGTRTPKPRGDSPIPVEVIDHDDIEASGAEDLAELLEDHPGIDLQRGMLGASLRMQGLEPEHVLITVDGNRLIGRRDGTLDLSRLPISEIERIEIVKGASSALYGSDAMGGVINIVTRRTSEALRGDGRVRYGSFNTTDATAGLSARGWRLAGGWHRTDGYDLDRSTLTTNGPAGQGFEVSALGQESPGDNLTLGLQAQYTRRNPQRISALDSGAVFDTQNLTEEARLSVAPTLTPDSRTRLSGSAALSLFRDQYLSDQRGAADLDVYEDSRQRLAQLTAQADRLYGSHLASLGAEAMLEGYSSPRLSEDGSRQRLAVFAQDDWSPTGSLSVLPGLRLDADSQFGRQLSPKVAVKWSPTPTLQLRSSYGRGFRAPSFRELLLQFSNLGSGYQVTGNTDLTAERSHGLNLEAAWSPGERLQAHLSAYANLIDDLIAIDLVGDQIGVSTYSYVNIGEAWTRGGEASASVRAWEAELSAGYALTDTHDVESDRPLPGRARHRGTASATVPLPRFSSAVTSRGRLVGAEPYYTDSNGDGVDETILTAPYANIDLRAERDLTEGLTVLFGVNNLLDAGDPARQTIQPRQLYGGLSGTF